MKTTYTILAAALMASAAFATAASAAEGEYYSGAGAAAHAPGVDLVTTHSTNAFLPRAMTGSETIDSGDYFAGSDRHR
ncbi:MAG: hypothetical protein SV862_13725 [Pseudomonadota bacterium]|nr:hypothetical protein [Pseudomonadota bacterium]